MIIKPITETHKADILDCISSLSSDEVFTPPVVAKSILDLLPPKVWSDPGLKFLDPSCKSGVFLRESARRLLVGLADAIPNEDDRRQHIFQSMLYGVALTELTGLISRRSLYCSKDASADLSISLFTSKDGNILYSRSEHRFVGKKCIACGAPKGGFDRGDHLENHAYQFIHKKDIFEMQFDVIIGNPPYQLQDAGESTGASPIYHHFISQAKALNPKYMSMIIPSRWFAGGKGLDEFRREMLADKRISHIVDYHDASDCFPGVEIKGGVCYFLWDRNHKGDCEVSSVLDGKRLLPMKRSLSEFDVFIRFNESVNILNKVAKYKEPSFAIKVSKRKPFGFSTNYREFQADSFEGAVKIFANKTTGWIERSKILVNRNWIDSYKVLLSRAYGAGSGYPHQIINKPILCEKGTCCTETYLVIGASSNKEETENICHYMKTKFFRFMVSLRKITQDNPSDRFEFVPDLDMSIRWSDVDLYKKYKLNKAEIDFIESMIKEMV